MDNTKTIFKLYQKVFLKGCIYKLQLSLHLRYSKQDLKLILQHQASDCEHHRIFIFIFFS
jgi:hypothetical protein